MNGINLENASNYEVKKEALNELIQNNASQAEQNQAFGEMMNALAEDTKTQVSQQMRAEMQDNQVVNERYGNKLTSEERKFFNEINTDVGYKDEELLPVTTIDRIFEDIQTAHPLLSFLNITNAGLVTRIIKSEPSGQAVWGKVFGEIKGQLDATFSEEEFTQNKLTCFVVVPKDLEEYGPQWVERYVRLQIKEAISVALEIAFLTGSGPAQNQPIGLTKDYDNENGAVTDKASKGTLTFADPDKTVQELTGLMDALAFTEKDGKALNLDGNVALVVNPRHKWALQAQYTHLNANGVYVTAMPFNLTIIESVFAPKEKVIGVNKQRYNAMIGGGVNVQKFSETLALEDCYLYTAKTFAHGLPEDNNASVVYDLNLNDTANNDTP